MNVRAIEHVGITVPDMEAAMVYLVSRQRSGTSRAWASTAVITTVARTASTIRYSSSGVKATMKWTSMPATRCNRAPSRTSV